MVIISYGRTKKPKFELKAALQGHILKQDNL